MEELFWVRREIEALIFARNIGTTLTSDETAYYRALCNRELELIDELGEAAYT
jgi:hypothetical protein